MIQGILRGHKVRLDFERASKESRHLKLSRLNYESILEAALSAQDEAENAREDAEMASKQADLILEASRSPRRGSVIRASLYTKGLHVDDVMVIKTKAHSAAQQAAWESEDAQRCVTTSKEVLAMALEADSTRNETVLVDSASRTERVHWSAVEALEKVSTYAREARKRSIEATDLWSELMKDEEEDRHKTELSFSRISNADDTFVTDGGRCTPPYLHEIDMDLKSIESKAFVSPQAHAPQAAYPNKRVSTPKRDVIRRAVIEEKIKMSPVDQSQRGTDTVSLPYKHRTTPAIVHKASPGNVVDSTVPATRDPNSSSGTFLHGVQRKKLNIKAT